MKAGLTMRIDELDGLTVFAAVAERRSFTAAAAMLGVSASAVSQAIRQLEARLDVTLFHRTTRSVGLTQAGELLFERAAPALGEMRAALDHARTLERGVAGLLRINLSRLAFRLSKREMRQILGQRYAATGRNIYPLGRRGQGAVLVIRAVLLGNRPLGNLGYLISAAPPMIRLKRHFRTWRGSNREDVDGAREAGN